MEERRIGRAREARHKLTVERLRQQMLELDACNCELRQQVQCLEQQVVSREWGSAAASAGMAAAAPATTAPPLASIVAERPEAGVIGGSNGNSPSAAGEERPPAAPEPSGARSPPAAVTAAHASQCVHQQESVALQVDAGQGSLEAAGSRPSAVHGALDLQLDACTQQSALEAPQQGAAGHSSSTWSTSACLPASCAKIVETGDAVAVTAQAGDCSSPALGHIDASGAMHRRPATGKPGSPDDLRRIGQSLLAGAADGQQSPVAAAPPSLGSSSGGSAAGDKVLSEVQHADGRTERTHALGLLEVHFANGSMQRSLPSGAKLTRFSNGDVKRVLPSGVVEYLYAEVDSWQVTHPSGVDVFFFPSGQVSSVLCCSDRAVLCLWQVDAVPGQVAVLCRAVLFYAVCCSHIRCVGVRQHSSSLHCWWLSLQLSSCVCPQLRAALHQRRASSPSHRSYDAAGRSAPPRRHQGGVVCRWAGAQDAARRARACHQRSPPQPRDTAGGARGQQLFLSFWGACGPTCKPVNKLAFLCEGIGNLFVIIHCCFARC